MLFFCVHFPHHLKSKGYLILHRPAASGCVVISEFHGFWTNIAKFDLIKYSKEDLIKYSKEDLVKYSKEDLMKYSKEDFIKYSKEYLKKYSKEDLMKYSKEYLIKKYSKEDLIKYFPTFCSTWLSLPSRTQPCPTYRGNFYIIVSQKKPVFRNQRQIWISNKYMYVVYFDHDTTCSQFTLESFQKLLWDKLERWKLWLMAQMASKEVVMLRRRQQWSLICDGKVEIAVTNVI